MHHSPQTEDELTQLLAHFDITPAVLAAHTSLPLETVKMTLDRDHCMRCPLISVIKVHCAIENLLQKRGWSGSSEALWRCLYNLLGLPTESFSSQAPG